MRVKCGSPLRGLTEAWQVKKMHSRYADKRGKLAHTLPRLRMQRPEQLHEGGLREGDLVEKQTLPVAHIEILTILLSCVETAT